MNVWYCRRTEDFAGYTASVSSHQGRRAFALAEAQPHYAPDRTCDIVHIALTLQLDMAQQTLRGTCATTVRAISEPVTSVALDAVDLHIAQVRQTGGQARAI